MKHPITLAKLARLLPRICAQDTSYKNDALWASRHPTWGHCTVVALLVQELFGGELLRLSLEGTPFSAGRFHYFNRTKAGRLVDLTALQFGTWRPRYRSGIVRRRAEVLRTSDVNARFRRLRRRFLRTQSPR